MYGFEDFRLEPGERRLWRGDTSVALTPKTFDLLLFLVEHEGRLLRKDDLLSAVWPDAAVEENNLTVAVSALRKALGESEARRFIETVPKTGYRFVARVTELKAETPPLPLNGVGPASQSEIGPTTMEGAATIAPTDALLQPKIPRREISARFRFLAVALALAVLIGLGYLTFAGRFSPKRAATAPRHLAILPFRNLRGNPQDEFLALSLADAVITQLGYIRALTVRPSYDIQKYTSQIVDLPKVAADLGVDTLLTGTFIHEDDNLRITGQLIDVNTRDLLWKGSFDIKYNKLLTVQERVAQEIIRGLELTLSPSEAARLKAGEAVDPLAYEYYLRGVDLYARNDFSLASKVLEKSLELGPNYAPAWASLGRAYNASASFQFGGDKQYGKAQAAFERALALQPDAIDARVYMANMFTDTGRVEKAVPLLREGISMNPSHAEAHWELGYAYRFAGMLAQSASECERARLLDPGVKLNSSTLTSYLYLGQYDRFVESLPDGDDVALIVFYRGFGEYYRQNARLAMKYFDRAFELDPSLPQARVGKALSLAIQHRRSEAKAILQALESKIGERGAYDPEAIYKIAQAYAVSGYKAPALRALKHSIENGFFPYSYLETDPLLDKLRREAGFSELMTTARQRHEAFERKFF
jgi:DNA-binding winged helix-turn-helix (wHTH) protein/TolB-like protein/Flp pilus assembly protein TadD